MTLRSAQSSPCVKMLWPRARASVPTLHGLADFKDDLCFGHWGLLPHAFRWIVGGTARAGADVTPARLGQFACVGGVGLLPCAETRAVAVVDAVGHAQRLFFLAGGHAGKPLFAVPSWGRIGSAASGSNPPAHRLPPGVPFVYCRQNKSIGNMVGRLCDRTKVSPSSATFTCMG